MWRGRPLYFHEAGTPKNSEVTYIYVCVRFLMGTYINIDTYIVCIRKQTCPQMYQNQTTSQTLRGELHNYRNMKTESQSRPTFVTIYALLILHI